MIYYNHKDKESEDTTMKYETMNAKQKKAFKNIYHAANWLVGGLENTLLDFEEGSREYKNAYERLHNHEGLVEELYDMAISEVYADGGMWFGDQAKRYLKDVRFCGKEWLMERCEKRIAKMGY